MANTLIFVAIILTFFSCRENVPAKPPKSKNPIDNIVEYVLEQKDNTTIELPEIYDSLATHILNDSTESSILAKQLEKRGFKVIKWSRGNFINIPRIINLTLQKGSCICDVSKIYYSTDRDKLFQLSERITCRDSSRSALIK